MVNEKTRSVTSADFVEPVKPCNVKTALDDLPDLVVNKDVLNMNSMPKLKLISRVGKR